MRKWGWEGSENDGLEYGGRVKFWQGALHVSVKGDKNILDGPNTNNTTRAQASLTTLAATQVRFTNLLRII